MTDFARLRPHQLQAAIAANTPVVLPIGVMEYHGQHLPAGVDLLAVTEVLDRLGDAIITLPPFAYGAASHAVAGPEHGTTLHVDAAALVPFFLKGVADIADPLALFQSDRIHPNEQAQPMMRDTVWPELRKLVAGR